MGLEAKDKDIIFPITPIGRPPAYDHELSAENLQESRGSNEENTAPSTSKQSTMQER